MPVGTARHAFVVLLKVCAQQKDLGRGSRVHADIVRHGMLEWDVFVGSSLINMYAKCGTLAKAQEVLDNLPFKDAAAWNALIAGYAQNGSGRKALKCYLQMQFEGVLPDDVTFACALKACGSVGATNKGQEIHAEIAQKRLLGKDPFVGTSLIDMYAKCGSLDHARLVFDNLPVRDVVAWSTLIAGYTEHGCCEEALNCFRQMQLEGVCPNAVTFVSVLKACGSVGSAWKGQEIHAEIAKKGTLERDVLVGTALVDMHVKCGSLAKAQQAFDKIVLRDVISWNALITGFVQHEHAQDALNCFAQMQLEGVCPDEVTFVCILKACGSLGAPDKGREIHVEIDRNGTLDTDLILSTALVDMYAKCGLLEKAHEVFDRISLRDVIVWNALISGYAQFGKVENVINIFDRMVGECIKPDSATFVSVLNACSHTGLVDRGQMYFESMIKDHGLVPNIEHYNCIFDLFGRSGQLGKVAGLIEKMPFPASIVVWHTVLAACRKWGNVEFARHAFEQAVQLAEKDPSAYVCMCNIFSDAGMEGNIHRIEAIGVESQG